MSRTNVDPQEIAKFEALASRWWDRESEFRPLHDINPLRANWIDLHSPLAERQVLDVGCGGGILSEGLAQRGADVTGIDMGIGIIRHRSPAGHRRQVPQQQNRRQHQYHSP